jgi:hypothetical protein
MRHAGRRPGIHDFADHSEEKSWIPRLFDLLPRGTYMTITADHGDCFGEDGFVGHGEVWNKMLLEVPFIEGRVPS